ncbi:MAG TPA: beta-ketoacyl-[acyl-carrier-protein] synthase family protein [Ktedonosporobacter sp.]|jgi:beta-ketoacyl-acyl-carrier-protein synthase II|nr:beta-ketoacyl-[acyl-carrier-protein] synthase family protein [Ktedonosporobacter sp.]
MSKASLHALRRVVITGLGVVAPNGTGKEPFWQACLVGRSGISHITRFDASQLPSQIAGEVADFAPQQLGLSADEILHMDRATQFGLAAANLAMQDAGLANALSEEEREQTGVYMGLAMACLEEGEKQWAQATGNGTYEPDANQNDTIPATLLMSHASASAIAAHHQLYGPCTVIATGCSAGADAIGQAFWLIQEGRADRMLAGGTDAAICYGVLDVFCVMGALSSNYNDAPARASRPYDQRRDGFVMAEGAGVVLLEEREQALARGAHIYAEIIAFSSNSNAYHMTSLPPDGTPLRHLLHQAMAEANITADELAYINSHGSSTPPNEAAETAAYKAVFGERARHIPISATKSMIGHTQGAASAIETIVTALVLDRQVIPPTINQEEPDPRCDLDYVPNLAREAAVNVALTHSSGFGGVNSVLVLAHDRIGQDNGN